MTMNNTLDDYFDVHNSSSRVYYQQNDATPKRDPLYIVIPITVVYAVIFVTGVVGNICTCVVISRNRSMHTATNYYLFSLAISDLLLLVSGLPPEMYIIWSRYPYIFGEAFCVVQSFTAETSANATVLTITAFTVERYVAICHPFLSHTMSKLSRAVKFVILVWVVAVCFAIPQAMSFGIVSEHRVCAVKRQVLPHAFEISTAVFFAAPMSLITVLYLLIALRLHTTTIISTDHHHKTGLVAIPGKCDGHDADADADADRCEHNQQCEERGDSRRNCRGKGHTRATRHVVNMLIAVVVAFFICWAPFHAQRLLAMHAAQTSNAEVVAIYTYLTYISGVLYYLSTCVNPLLYNIMSNKFRNAFRETLSRYMPGVFKPRPAIRRYSTMSLPRSLSPTRSQSFSQSGGTYRQPSFRYIDGDLTRRPLVVSFKKINAGADRSSACGHTPRCSCRRAICIQPDRDIQETTFIEESAQDHRRGHKKWTARRNRCQLICAECHRHLDPERHDENNKQIVVLISDKNGKTFVESSSSSGETAYAIAVKESGSDLIPRHQCPKLINPPRLAASGPKGAGLAHSRTMPDIVATLSKHGPRPKQTSFDEAVQPEWENCDSLSEDQL